MRVQFSTTENYAHHCVSSIENINIFEKRLANHYQICFVGHRFGQFAIKYLIDGDSLENTYPSL